MPLTHRQVAVVLIRAAMAAWRWHADDVLVHALPLYHQHGLGGLHTALIAGGTVHIRSKFRRPTWCRQPVTPGPACCSRYPPSTRRWWNPPAHRPAGRRAAGPAPGGMRFGSAEPGAGQLLLAVLGRLPVIRYGTTESGLNVSNPVAGPHGDTIGVPLPGVLARTLGPRMAGQILARTARSSSAGRRSSRATGTTRRPPRPRSPRTAGSAPATSGPWTRPPGTW